MALLLAPYNNGMRLGQGFNSYTQQICIDDAVVIDPDRVDNPVTNDGFTMRELRYAIGARAGNNLEDDYDDSDPRSLVNASSLSNNKSTDTPEGTDPSVDSQGLIGPAPPTALDSMAIQLNQDVKTVSKLVQEIAELESAVEEATQPDSDGTKKNVLLLEKKRMRLARLKTTGFGLKSGNHRGAARDLAHRGPSQIVTYNSRFVNKISEVTDDMNISGSLSIKYGAIGGSGKGSFIDSDKFKESDLNFFISVKVINQSINIKDALVFQGLPSVDESNFRQVFGDCFVSGFLEGGEFNALVSMKVLNKDKRMAVKAEAEIALSVGAVDIKADAKVAIEKSNFSSQTETTIQVGWSGGGHIKPMDQPWTIQTLMETAAKFPDLVANTPQRTYAILTKYESLRSFMALKPPKLKPMYYENAAIYTNTLLDAYMDYKNIYRNIGTNLFDIQAGTKKFGEWPELTVLADAETLKAIDDESRFAATIKGLDLARRACRFQMVKIVKEVDAVEQHPDYAADETRPEAFQSPIVFRERLPLVKDKEKMPRIKAFGTDEPYPNLLDPKEGDGVTEAEAAKAASYLVDQPDVGEFQRLAPMIGSVQGQLFCNLDFIKPDFSLRTVTVEMSGPFVVGLSVRYANGLLAAVGTSGGDRKISMTVHPEDGEKIIACSIETGRPKGVADAPTRVTAVRLYTNRGPDLLGNAEDWRPAPSGEGRRCGVEYEGLTIKHFDPLLVDAHIKGFWGYGVTTSRMTAQSGIYRLAPIWGSKQDTSPTVGVPVDDSVDQSTIVTQGEAFTIGGRGNFGWTEHRQGGWWSYNHQFKERLPIIPVVLYSIGQLDVHPQNSPRVCVDLPKVSESGFTLKMRSFLHKTFDLKANVMVLPNGKVPFQHGQLDANGMLSGRAPTQNAVFTVKFNPPFRTAPKAYVWFTEISQPKGQRSLKTFVTDVTAESMVVKIETWDGREFEAATVSWLAWPSEFDGKGVKAGNTYFKKDEAAQEGDWYGGNFAKQPNLFCGINYIDFPESSDRWLRMWAKEEWATKEKLRWHGGTWGDTLMEYLGMCWIAVE